MPFSILFQTESPHGLCIGVRLPEPSEATGEQALEHLRAEERVFASRFPARRRITWAGGRVALHAALHAAGCSSAGPIFATDRGAPALPHGVAGSISHKPGLAVALVAPSAAWSVGVDVENARAPRADIARHVLREEERKELASLDPEQRWREVLARFSAKEAVYKALDPFVQRYVSFQEVGVSNERRVHLELRGGEGPFEVEASCQNHGEFLLATARVRRRGDL